MKKLIALMMCAMLLLSGCEAVTAEGPGVGLQLRDLIVSRATGESLDLTGLSATIETAVTDTSAGLRLAVSGEDGESLDLVAGVVGQNLYLSMPGAEGTNSYALDMVKVSQAISDALEGIAEELNGILPAIFSGTDEDTDGEPEEEIPEMTDEELAAALAELEAAMAEMEDSGELDEYAPEAEDDEVYADLPELSEEEMAALEEAAAKRAELLARCMTVDAKQIDGEDFTVIGLNFTADDMMELIELTDTSGIGLGELLDASGAAFSLEGAITGNEDFTKFLFDLTITAAGQEEHPFNITVDSMAGDGSFDISACTVQEGQPAAGVSLTVAVIDAESADWLPQELGEDTVVLTDMSQDSAVEALEQGFAEYGAVLEQAVDSVSQANQAG